MMTVYKFPFDLDDIVVLKMPTGSEVLHVEVQHGVPCLWARVDPKAALEVRRFRVAGTGHPLKEDVGEHLGSLLMRGGSLVFHVFELP